MMAEKRPVRPRRILLPRTPVNKAGEPGKGREDKRNPIACVHRITVHSDPEGEAGR